MLGLPSLRASEEALRRWMNAVALVRPASRGGSVVVVAGGELPAVQALVRWDPATFAARELAEREELRLPPATRMASVTGTPEAVESLLAVVRLPPGAELLGPLPVTDRRAGSPQAAIRYLLRVPRSLGPELATALRDGQAVRSAAKEPGSVRVQVDPAVLI